LNRRAQTAYRSEELLYFEIIALAFALAADAFAVGASVGVSHFRPRQIFRLSFHFGLFQGLFALCGAIAGTLFLPLVESYDHWIVFMVLAGLGGHMIYGALRGKSDHPLDLDLTRGVSMIGLSTAVSIDALGAGVGLPAVGAPIVISVVIIGLVTVGATLLAMVMAQKIADRIGKYCEIGAGLALIGLGIWAPVSHIGLVN
jgi:manganese efflux pump family protein